jgi:hypothetical protein
MFEAGSSLGFSAEALQVCFGSPGAETDYLQRNGAIETLLMRAINYTLTPRPISSSNS